MKCVWQDTPLSSMERVKEKHEPIMNKLIPSFSFEFVIGMVPHKFLICNIIFFSLFFIFIFILLTLS